MTSKLNPYLTFNGEARASLEFYQSVFGGEYTARSFKEAGVPVPAEREDQLMHGELITVDGFTIMASDDPEGVSKSDTNIAVSGEDLATLQAYWDKLIEGAEITANFETAPWGDTFGMLNDKFGVRWMINVVVPKV